MAADFYVTVEHQRLADVTFVSREGMRAARFVVLILCKGRQHHVSLDHAMRWRPLTGKGSGRHLLDQRPVLLPYASAESERLGENRFVI